MIQAKSSRTKVRTQQNTTPRRDPPERRRKVKGGLKSNYHIFSKAGKPASRKRSDSLQGLPNEPFLVRPGISLIPKSCLSVCREISSNNLQPTNVLKVKFTPVTFLAWERTVNRHREESFQRMIEESPQSIIGESYKKKIEQVVNHEAPNSRSSFHLFSTRIIHLQSSLAFSKCRQIFVIDQNAPWLPLVRLL